MHSGIDLSQFGRTPLPSDPSLAHPKRTVKDALDRMIENVEQNTYFDYLMNTKEESDDLGFSDDYDKSLFHYTKETTEFLHSEKIRLAELAEDYQGTEEEKVDYFNQLVRDIIKNWRPLVDKHFGYLKKKIQNEKTRLERVQAEEEMEARKREEEETFRLLQYVETTLSYSDEYDDPEIGVVRREKFKSNSKSFALALYAHDNYYGARMKLGMKIEDIHLPPTEEDIKENIYTIFKKNYKMAPLEIAIGHEHGQTTGKCHFVVCVFLPETMQRLMEPFHISMGHPSVRYIGMYLETKNSHSISNYSKNENLFRWKSVLDKGYHSIHSNMSVSDFSDHLKKTNMRDFLNYGDKMISNFVTLVQQRDIPDFEWKYPVHFEEEKFSRRMDIIQIKQWFEKYCLQTQPRQKALLLYSKDRGMGKTFLSKSLVNDPEYYIYDRYTLNAESFRMKTKAKLVILDDIQYQPSQKELWKALVAGEEVNIRTPYHNYNFKNGIPCIISTNSLPLVKSWYSDPEFNTQVKFIEVTDYLGPDGTRPVDLTLKECFFSPETLKELTSETKKTTASSGSGSMLKKKRTKTASDNNLIISAFKLK